jgi:hypothetical protein
MAMGLPLLMPTGFSRVGRSREQRRDMETTMKKERV